MKQNATAILASFFVLLIITTIVLPGRPTPAVVQSFFDLMSSTTRSILGRKPQASGGSGGGNFQRL